MRLLRIILVVALSATLWERGSGQGCQADSHRTDCGYIGIDEGQCVGKGCCWSPKDNEPYCFNKTSAANITCHPNAPRGDCGYFGIDAKTCENKGCCWSPMVGQPYCFYKTGEAIAYVVENVTHTPLGVKIFLNKTSEQGPFGNSISPLVVEITAQTAERLHVKLYDPNNQRWEIPTRFSPVPGDPSVPPVSPLYKYSYPSPGEPFYFEVSRLSNKESLFKTSPSTMEYADQYLQLQTALPDNNYLYGLGDHVTQNLRLSPQTCTMWNFDTATPPNLNLYGSHPFYLEQRTSGFAHGVFLRNSNGMDVILQPTSLTYKVIGGVLDFYFFLGPQPEAVIQQYQQVIGRPHFPPFWGLGFHQCRYGYQNVDQLQQVVQGYASAKIPLDTMWTDIDYMDQYKDFTLDPKNFPADKMSQFVSSLHDNGQHYVVIIDPGIKTESGYGAYDDGVKEDIFLKDSGGNIFTGKVWPGICAFVDYTNPSSQSYWQSEISKFLQLLPVDGLWMDMNEPSNFCNGECISASDASKPRRDAGRWRSKHVFDPSNPPYAIDNQGDRAALNVKTTDMDVTHYDGQIVYNTHNLFGLMESVTTNYAIQNITKKRSFLISRSTFPGSGHHTGHWTGDNFAKWEYLAYGLPHVLSFQLFGIPMIGNDICGFIGDTNEELCSRWIEVGAFFPFSRNHNNKGSQPQELYVWDSVAAISRSVLAIRYSLLPYYYTLFYKASRPVQSTPAATVLRPLFFEFPDDQATYTIDRQFLVGSGFLVSPVVEQGKTSVSVYFPSGKWYDLNFNVISTGGKETKTLMTPIDQIQLHYRGGTIFPMLAPGLTTTETRKNNFTLLAALDVSGNAAGDLFWDDGEQVAIEKYFFVDYKSTATTMTATVSGPGGVADTPALAAVVVVGVSSQPHSATINGVSIAGISYNSSTQKLTLSNLATPMDKGFTITWE